MKNIIYADKRIQIINGNVIRIEQRKDHQFLDKETLFVPSREEFVYCEDYSLNEEKDGLRIGYKNYEIYIPKRGMKECKVLKDKKLIYTFKKIKNKGELPPLNKTPAVFPIMDSPHLILPENGYSITSKEEYIVEENVIDLYLLLAENDHRKLRRLFVEICGRNEMVRLQNFGVWNSKWYPYTEEEAKQVILDYEKHDVPLDNMVLDTDWRIGEKWGVGYDINVELFPDIKRFFDFAHSRNIEIIANDHPEPVIGAQSAMDKKEIAFREEKLKHVMELGLDSWWYDRNWMVKLIPPSKNITPETIGFYLFHDVTKSFYQAKANNKKIFRRPIMLGNVDNIANGVYKGISNSASHRFSVQWTGDVGSDMLTFNSEIKNLVKASISDIAYYNTDNGGHTGNPSKDDIIRWTTYGVLSPIYRPHCTKDCKVYREPWLWDEECLNIIRDYINMRYRLMPIIYSEAFNNYLNGEPMFKSLGYNYVDDERACKELNSYMLGHNILISPTVKASEAEIPQKNYLTPVKAKFYNNKELKGEVIYEREYTHLNENWFEVSPGGNVPVYNFSATFETVLKFEEDVDFYFESDDGGRIYIDGVLVFEDWSDHSPTRTKVYSFKKDVEYKVFIEYYQAGGGASISLFCKRNPNSNEYTKKMYFPEGEWMDMFNEVIYKGKQDHKIKFNYYDVQLFSRIGSLNILARNAKNLVEQKWNDLVLDFYPSKKYFDAVNLYEDDYETTAYKYGEHRISEYKTSYDKEHNRIVIDAYAAKGTFKSDKCFASREIMVKYHLLKGVNKVSSVLINGEAVDFEIVKKDDVFPYSDSKASRNSDTLVFSFTQDVNKDYKIEFVL